MWIWSGINLWCKTAGRQRAEERRCFDSSCGFYLELFYPHHFGFRVLGSACHGMGEQASCPATFRQVRRSATTPSRSRVECGGHGPVYCVATTRGGRRSTPGPWLDFGWSRLRVPCAHKVRGHSLLHSARKCGSGNRGRCREAGWQLVRGNFSLAVGRRKVLNDLLVALGE